MAHGEVITMDRYSPRLIRGAAAAGVSIFLVAGAAFAANAVLGAPHSSAQDFVPAAATSSHSPEVEATETAEPTGTAEPIRTHDATTGTAEPAETAGSGEKAEGTEKAKATEPPEPTGTAEPTRSPKAPETAEPTGTSGDQDQSGDAQGSGDNNGGDRDGARPALPIGTTAPGATATPEPTHSLDGGGNGSHGGGNG
jgi:hypothetical protein